MMSRKRKRKEGSPLLEMPDLSQSHNVDLQASASSSHVLQLDTMQVFLSFMAKFRLSYFVFILFERLLNSTGDC